MLATPFGDYIGEAYVLYVTGAQSVVDKQLDEGYDKQMEHYNKEMNEGYFVNYVETGLYKSSNFIFDPTHPSYNPDEVYEASYEEPIYSWKLLIDENILALDDSVLRNGFISRPSTETDKLGNYIKGDLVINNAVLVISKECFKDCKDLSSVYIKSVQMIDDNAFKDCEKLRTLYINTDELQIIGKKVFEGTNLRDIYYNGTKTQFCQIKWAEFSGKNVTIHCIDQEFSATI
jgi:hypothetical protein